MFCFKCGAQIPDGSKFCTACGAQLSQAVEPQPQPVEQPVPQPQPVEQPVEQSVSPEPQHEQTPQPQPTGVQFNQVPPQPQPYGQPMGQPFNPIPQEKPKKSPLVPILICVIAAALVATGVILFLFVFKGGSGSVAGEYHAKAVEINGYVVDISQIPYASSSADLTFTLNDDGTGSMSMSGQSRNLTWTLDGTKLDICDATTGKSFSEAFSMGSVEFKNGRIMIHAESGSFSGTTILAKTDDDLSDLDMLTMADFMSKYGEIFGQN